jgi:hypothetical protein
MLGERLFRVCDRDRDNGIDWQEFLSAVALLVHGTEEARYRLLFDVRRSSSASRCVCMCVCVCVFAPVSMCLCAHVRQGRWLSGRA